ncbi:zf-CCHC_4 domain-containing protein [Cephalotus follicularis]|uniref:Zf-CCHC_4 domain-containing protein n=1 Tax=Cephalotus follicularis TaxID=3775 RepID=A0A1Q3CB01_CEPFO|nr:zf-CCHC_4 domain-containing protein [Cephalotus follicularis]
MMLSYGSDGRVWIQFRYEKLPNFCFSCGSMGHLESECDQVKQDGDLGKGVTFQYGHWLRAEGERSGREGAVNRGLTRLHLLLQNMSSDEGDGSSKSSATEKNLTKKARGKEEMSDGVNGEDGKEESSTA